MIVLDHVVTCRFFLMGSFCHRILPAATSTYSRRTFMSREDGSQALPIDSFSDAQLHRMSTGTRRRQAGLQPHLPSSSPAGAPDNERPYADDVVDEQFSDAVEQQPSIDVEPQPSIDVGQQPSLEELLDQSEAEMEWVLAQEAQLERRESLGTSSAANGLSLSPISPPADLTQGALSVTFASPAKVSPHNAESTAPSASATADQLLAQQMASSGRGRGQHGNGGSMAPSTTISSRQLAATGSNDFQQLDASFLPPSAASVLGLSGQQQRASPMLAAAAERRHTVAYMRGRGRGQRGSLTSRRTEDIAPFSERAMEIAPTNLFSPGPTSTQKSVHSPPLSLPTSVQAPVHSSPPPDSLYSLGMRMAVAANVSSEEYSRHFSEILSRLVRSYDCEIVFVDGNNTPRITSVNSISIQADSTLLIQCVCQQFRGAPTFFKPLSQLWMIPRNELGSALHAGSSIQPLSSILEEAVTQCSIMYIGHKAPVADSAASAADPLRQFRGDCGTGAQSQKESYSSGSRDTSGRSDRRRQHDDFDGAVVSSWESG